MIQLNSRQWLGLSLGLLLGVGTYWVVQDMISMLHQQKTSLERSAKAASLYLSPGAIADATSTKNSQSQADSQLFEALKQAQEDLNLSGDFHVVRMEADQPIIIVSTSTGAKKGDALTWPETMRQAALSGNPYSTGLYRNQGTFWMSAIAAIPTDQAAESILLSLEAPSSSLFYQLLTYALHYVFLGIGTAVFAFIIFHWATNRSLKQSRSLEAQLRVLFHQIHDSALILDSDGKVVSVNPAAQKLLQTSPEKLLGKNCFVPGESHFSFIPLDNSKNILKTTLERNQQMSGRAKIVFDSDLVRYVDFSANPIELDAGVGALVILRDISFELLRDSRVTADPLTKTYNRQYLLQVLEPQSLQNLFNSGCSLLLIDLDRFKGLNDLKGRNYGDIILKQFADFLRSFFRRTDEIIRSGGDEFVVLLPGVRAKEAARIAGNFISDLARQPFGDGDRLTASLGISELQAAENGKDWLERARVALGEAKQSGGTFRIQTSEGLEIIDEA